MNTTEKAIELCMIRSSTWLSLQLDLTRKTVYSKKKKGNWKKLEIEKINELYRKL